MAWVCNTAGLQIVKDSEAGAGINAMDKQGRYLFRTCYADPKGIPTIGYGNIHSVTKVDIGKKTITELEADMLLSKDMAYTVGVLNKMCVGIPLTNNQFSAWCSLAFNIGTHALEGSTSFARAKAGDMHGAAEAIMFWNKAKIDGVLTPEAGLTTRRTKETALFLLPDGVEFHARLPGDTPVHESIPGAVARVVAESTTMMNVVGSASGLMIVALCYQTQADTGGALGGMLAGLALWALCSINLVMRLPTRVQIFQKAG